MNLLMSERASRYLVFFGAAAVMFVLVVEGFDILARVRIGGESLTEALSETIHYALVQPVGTLFSFAPFKSIPIVLVAFGLRFVLGRNHVPAKA